MYFSHIGWSLFFSVHICKNVKEMRDQKYKEMKRFKSKQILKKEKNSSIPQNTKRP